MRYPSYIAAHMLSVCSPGKEKKELKACTCLYSNAARHSENLLPSPRHGHFLDEYPPPPPGMSTFDEYDFRLGNYVGRLSLHRMQNVNI